MCQVVKLYMDALFVVNVALETVIYEHTIVYMSAGQEPVTLFLPSG